MRKKYIIGSMICVVTAAAVVTVSANGIFENTASGIATSSYEATVASEAEAKLANTDKETPVMAANNINTAYFADKAVVDMSKVKTYINIRSEASNTNATSVARVYSDTVVTVLDRQRDWTLVESEGVTGWIATQFLLFGDDAVAAVPTMRAVANSEIQLYSVPDVSTEAFATANAGYSYRVVNMTDEWVEAVTDAGETIFIQSGNVSLKENVLYKALVTLENTPLYEQADAASNIIGAAQPGYNYEVADASNVGNGWVTVVTDDGTYASLETSAVSIGYHFKAAVPSGQIESNNELSREAKDAASYLYNESAGVWVRDIVPTTEVASETQAVAQQAAADAAAQQAAADAAAQQANAATQQAAADAAAQQANAAAQQAAADAAAQQAAADAAAAQQAAADAAAQQAAAEQAAAQQAAAAQQQAAAQQAAAQQAAADAAAQQQAAAQQAAAQQAAQQAAADAAAQQQAAAQQAAAEQAAAQQAAQQAAAQQAAAEQAAAQQAAAQQAAAQQAAAQQQAAAEQAAAQQAAAQQAVAQQAAAQQAAAEQAAAQQAAAQQAAAQQAAAEQAAAQQAAAEQAAAQQAAAQQQAASQQYLGSFRVTHYCSCPICCGSFSNPGSSVIGAAGVPLTPGASVAVDPNQIPYGSRIMINGNVYVAADTGVGANCVDIFMGNDHATASAGGMYYADVYLVK